MVVLLISLIMVGSDSFGGMIVVVLNFFVSCLLVVCFVLLFYGSMSDVLCCISVWLSLIYVVFGYCLLVCDVVWMNMMYGIGRFRLSVVIVSVVVCVLRLNLIGLVGVGVGLFSVVVINWCECLMMCVCGVIGMCLW